MLDFFEGLIYCLFCLVMAAAVLTFQIWVVKTIWNLV